MMFDSIYFDVLLIFSDVIISFQNDKMFVTKQPNNSLNVPTRHCWAHHLYSTANSCEIVPF